MQCDVGELPRCSVPTGRSIVPCGTAGTTALATEKWPRRCQLLQYIIGLVMVSMNIYMMARLATELQVCLSSIKKL